MGDRRISFTDVPVDVPVALAATATRPFTAIACDSVSNAHSADSASTALRRQRTLADVVRGVFGLPSRYGLTESDREELAAWIDGLATARKTPATGSGAQLPCIARRARAG